MRNRQNWALEIFQTFFWNRLGMVLGDRDDVFRAGILV